MIEYLDIVDKNDKVIGKKSRNEVYNKKLCHRIVHILIFNSKNEIALQLRSKNVSFCPNYWSTSVGGHVLSGETYEQGAIREFKEELGINQKIDFFSKDFYTPNKFLVTFKTTFDGPFNPNLEEVEKIEFFSLEKIKQMINNKSKFNPELLFLLEKHFL